jgi:MoaA/NifB/PqqE/SkfB family radical SAM enzyme
MPGLFCGLISGGPSCGELTSYTITLNALRYLPFAVRGLRRKGPPLHLTLFVTGACNLRCRHCFHFKEVAEGLSGPSLDEVRRLADSAARMGPLLWVSFGGGEPFLRPDLAELAGAFGRHGLRHLAIPTNGMVERTQHQQVQNILRAAPETFLSISVSIDGPPEIHDAIRAEEGSHARAIESLLEYRRQADREERLGLGITVTLTSENQDCLPEYIEELARKVRPDNITLGLARHKALDESLLKVDLDRYQELVAAKARLMRSGQLAYFDFPLAKVAAARDEMMYRHVEGVARGGGAWLPCTAGSLSAVIFEDGVVQPCEVLGATIGNLAETDWDLERLWNSERASELRRKIRDTRCTCTYECAQGDNVLFRPASWPRLGRALLAKRP